MEITSIGPNISPPFLVQPIEKHSPKTVFLVDQHCYGRGEMLKVEEEQQQEDNLFEQQRGL